MIVYKITSTAIYMVKMELKRKPTGISGFDRLVDGGLWEKSTYLLTGTAGACKTTFSLEFLYRGAINYNEVGLYISFEESIDKLKFYMKQFGWDLDKLENEKKLIFLDYSIHKSVGKNFFVFEDFDLSGLFSSIKETIYQTGAKRVVLDSLPVLVSMFKNLTILRKELGAIKDLLEQSGCTSIIISEIPPGDQGFSRYGIEEFVVDGIFILKYISTKTGRQRAIEVYKMRGTRHATGDYAVELMDDGFHIGDTVFIE